MITVAVDGVRVSCVEIDVCTLICGTGRKLDVTGNAIGFVNCTVINKIEHGYVSCIARNIRQTFRAVLTSVYRSRNYFQESFIVLRRAERSRAVTVTVVRAHTTVGFGVSKPVLVSQDTTFRLTPRPEITIRCAGT